MPRPLRIQYPGALYHITARGNEKRDIFLDNGDRRKFLSLMKDLAEEKKFVFHAYCLMKNHYHILLETPFGNLSQGMQWINTSYSAYFNTKRGVSGHLFQGRFKSLLVDKENYLQELSRYIHLNPVRAGLVTNPENYEWSSYLDYISRRESATWIQTTEILEYFGQGKEATQNYVQFVHEGLSKSDDLKKRIHAATYCGFILGAEDFINDVLPEIQAEKLSEDISWRRRIKKKTSPESIIAAVAELYGTETQDLLFAHGKQNEARMVAIYFCGKYSELNQRELGKVFGNVSGASIGNRNKLVRQKQEKDEGFHRKLKEIESQLS